MSHTPSRLTAFASLTLAVMLHSAAHAGGNKATLMPFENSIEGVGVQVWVVIDGVIPPPPASRFHPPLVDPVPVDVASYQSVMAEPARYQASRYEIGDEDHLNHIPRPPIERDAQILASIPSFSGMAVPLDPDRYRNAPVALHLESATIEQIVEQLVPMSYRIELDVPESLRKKRFRIALDTTVADAFTEVSKRTGVLIQPYHRLGLVMVSYQGAPQ